MPARRVDPDHPGWNLRQGAHLSVRQLPWQGSVPTHPVVVRLELLPRLRRNDFRRKTTQGG